MNIEVQSSHVPALARPVQTRKWRDRAARFVGMALVATVLSACCGDSHEHDSATDTHTPVPGATTPAGSAQAANLTFSIPKVALTNQQAEFNALLTNPSSTALTSSFTLTLDPSDATIVLDPARASTCGGPGSSLQAVGNQIIVTNVQIPANDSCVIYYTAASPKMGLFRASVTGLTNTALVGDNPDLTVLVKNGSTVTPLSLTPANAQVTTPAYTSATGPFSFPKLQAIVSNGSDLFALGMTEGDPSTIARINSSGVAEVFLSNLPSYVFGMTTDGTSLFVTTDNKIIQINIATKAQTVLAGSDSRGFQDGVGAAARFARPVGLATDGVNLYVTDQDNRRVRQIVIATGVVTTIAGNGSQGSADGIGNAATFDRLEGIVTDGINLYVADMFAHKIKKIVIASKEVSTLAGSGSSASVDGVGTSAALNAPAAMSADASSLYVVENGLSGQQSKIRKVDIASGQVTSLAGNGTSARTDGAASSAGFYGPTGLTVVGRDIYVAEGSFFPPGAVRKISN